MAGTSGGNIMWFAKEILSNLTGLALAAAVAVFPLTAGAMSTDGQIDSKQLAPQPLVVVGGESYHVTENTVLEGVQGERLELSQLPALEEGASSDDAAAYLEWHQSGPRRILESLELTGTTD